MATISEYFDQAQLSEAAYSEGLQSGWFGGGTEQFPSPYALRLMNEGKGMSKTQAIDFANKYKVIEQYTDPESGFSGMVFEKMDEEGNPTGQFCMAIRGTERSSLGNFWDDLMTDIADIGADGIAIDQGIAMYNWYQRLISPKGSTPVQYEYIKEKTVLNSNGEEVIETPASLKVIEGVQPTTDSGGFVGESRFSVTGH